VGGGGGVNQAQVSEGGGWGRCCVSGGINSRRPQRESTKDSDEKAKARRMARREVV